MTQPDCTGSVNITLPMPTIAPATPPGTYLGVAYGMMSGVRVLAATTPLPNLALAMLSAHVLECALKAYLSRSGNDSAVRSRKVRHNLAKLWTLAHADGLRIPEQPPQWAELLGQAHDDPYYLRYSTGVHAVSTPAPSR